LFSDLTHLICDLNFPARLHSEGKIFNESCLVYFISQSGDRTLLLCAHISKFIYRHLWFVYCNEPVDVKGLFTRPISEVNFALG
jgi:hypothetical protein